MPRPDSSVVERGPEKAGVGGSIPSLATIFSTTYKLKIAPLRSKTFHCVAESVCSQMKVSLMGVVPIRFVQTVSAVIANGFAT
jgi:hypothetical protein